MSLAETQILERLGSRERELDERLAAARRQRDAILDEARRQAAGLVARARAAAAIAAPLGEEAGADPRLATDARLEALRRGARSRWPEAVALILARVRSVP